VTVAIAVMDYAEAEQRETLSHEQFERFYTLTMPRLRSYICRICLPSNRQSRATV